jgi:hypothetical protein
VTLEYLLFSVIPGVIILVILMDVQEWTDRKRTLGPHAPRGQKALCRRASPSILTGISVFSGQFGNRDQRRGWGATAPGAPKSALILSCFYDY